MKAGDKDEILIFFDQYFTDEEELLKSKQKLELQEEERQLLRKRMGNMNSKLNHKREELMIDDLLNFSTQRQVIGVVITKWVWETTQQKQNIKAKYIEISPDSRQIYI